MKNEKTFDVNADGSERLEYNHPDVPVRALRGVLSDLSNYAAQCHWHRDFEWLTATDGAMDYFVNGEIVHLNQGDTIFVNAGRLHYGFSADRSECAYRFAVLDPKLLGELAPVVSAIERLSMDESPDHAVLETDSRAGALVERLIECVEERRTFPMLSACAELIDLTMDALRDSLGTGALDESWLMLRRMTGYIQDNYTETIRLDDIAAAAAVCRNTCCKLFREKLNCTPGEYVTNYRLNKACAMMAQGSSVTEAALSCGFNGSSYFSETFRKVFKMTPKEYKRMMAASE